MDVQMLRRTDDAGVRANIRVPSARQAFGIHREYTDERDFK
jgi:hypothetical protein